ncbi:MAG: hypothetical protein GY761_02470, partial [Hyphomicrobiales bacterium]|nr:hypothetical protein [Hyphomicrobiales bacterium]
IQNVAEMLYSGDLKQARLTQSNWNERRLKRIHFISTQKFNNERTTYEDYDLQGYKPTSIMAEITKKLVDNSLPQPVPKSGKIFHALEDSPADTQARKAAQDDVMYICWEECINIDSYEAVSKRMQNIIAFEKIFDDKSMIQFDITSGRALYSALVAVESRHNGVVFSYINKDLQEQGMRSVIGYDVRSI